jgi:CMP-N-acetylneuraminic acid synthetase
MSIAVIPARGGSVRCKRKNVKLLDGLPLIVHTIRQALESKVFDSVIVSTEDIEIKDISMRAGATVIARPKELSEDVETELVIKHVIEELAKRNHYPNIITLLQCTSPLRKIETIRKCVQTLKDNYESADSVVTVSNVEGNRPEWMCYINNGRIVPYVRKWELEDEKEVKLNPYIKLVARQSLPELYKQNGCVYTFKKDLIMKYGIVIGTNCIPVIIDDEESLDIDTDVDFTIIEEIIKSKKPEIDINRTSYSLTSHGFIRQERLF